VEPEQGKIVHWDHGYRNNKFKIDELMSFLRENTGFVEEHRRISTIKLVGNITLGRDKLYFLFLDALNAGGGSSLKRNGEACTEMIKRLNTMASTPTVSFKEFYRTVVLGYKKFVFDNNKKEISKHLFEGLRTQFVNFKFKKAALFMKELHDAQSYEACRIFHDIEASEIYLPIPLDVVISEVISQVLGFECEDIAHRVVAPVDGQRFTEWAQRNLGEEYYLIEDLWFWGYFGLGRPEKKGYRKIGLNEAKFSTCPWAFPPTLGPIRGKVNEFRRILERPESYRTEG
jgi:hypothetical protein